MPELLRCYFCRAQISSSNARYAKSIMITSIKAQYPAFTPDKPMCQMCYAKAFHQLKRLFAKSKAAAADSMSTTNISDTVSTSSSLGENRNERDSESRNSESSTQPSQDAPIQQSLPSKKRRRVEQQSSSSNRLLGQSRDVSIQPLASRSQDTEQPSTQTSTTSGEELIPHVVSESSDDDPIHNPFTLRVYETDEEDLSCDDVQVVQPIIRRRKVPIKFPDERIVPIFSQIPNFGG